MERREWGNGMPRKRGRECHEEKGELDLPCAMLSSQLPQGTKSTLTLGELDRFLDELAAPSTFSQLSLEPMRPSAPPTILQRLFRDSSLSPLALSVLVQIILRDLRPLLYPLPPMPVRHPTALLRCKSTAAPQQLSLHVAMWCWDPAMARLYRDGKGNVDWCADMAESITKSPHSLIPMSSGPVVGINVQVSRCRLLFC